MTDIHSDWLVYVSVIVTCQLVENLHSLTLIFSSWVPFW